MPVATDLKYGVISWKGLRWFGTAEECAAGWLADDDLRVYGKLRVLRPDGRISHGLYSEVKPVYEAMDQLR